MVGLFLIKLAWLVWIRSCSKFPMWNFLYDGIQEPQLETCLLIIRGKKTKQKKEKTKQKNTKLRTNAFVWDPVQNVLSIIDLVFKPNLKTTAS